jgi:5'-3' exonuclease
MINILIDGNYIFHKTFGVFGGWGAKDPAEILGPKSEQAMFIRKIATDLCASLRKIPGGGRLVFTADSRSWRKDVEIKGGGYKSNRIKDENVDWSIFFDLIQSFGEHLEKNGYIFSKANGAEGDDLLYFWADYFNSKGENCIVISGDKDLHQLARWKGNNWTIIWNSNSKNNVLSIPDGWIERWLDMEAESSVFNMGAVMDPDKDKLRSFINGVSVNEVQVRDFVFIKMLTGDKGDAVPGIWEYEKNGKMQKITPKRAEKIMESLLESKWKDHTFSQMLDDEEFLDWISGFSLRLIKDLDNNENRSLAASNLIRNYKLMWLDKSVIPRPVIDSIISEIKRGISLEKKPITLDRVKILEGTSWISTSAPKSFDPFSNF